MKRIQSLPNRIACSDYIYRVGDFERVVWISIYSPNFQVDGLASHWMSRVILQDTNEASLGGTSGIGACSFQALSSALYLVGYKLLTLSNNSPEVYFYDKQDSKHSIASLLASDSSSILEPDNFTDMDLGSPVIADFGGSIILSESGSEFSFSILSPICDEDEVLYCSFELNGLDYRQTYTSNDSTRVLAKTLRGLHRKLLSLTKNGFKVKDTDGSFVEEKNLWCLFYSAEKLSSVFSKEKPDKKN